MKNIPSELSNKIQTPLQTLANNADPKMAITVVRAKDTVMDNTYWTTEVIRTKTGLGDLSVATRRLKPHGSPDSIYNIYVDNGIVKAAIRQYPDHQKNGWQEQFILGPGSAVAIAFDGYWGLYKGKWQMVTSEVPWIFWISGGVLWSQYWDDINTRIELATGVSKVKAIRGWKNVNMPSVDQGVIAGYIKTDGKVYYRNYAFQEATSQFGWEFEKEIIELTGSYVNLNLFITNDYRVGFIVEDSVGQISWAITERAWAGMAIAPEYFNLTLDANIRFIEIDYKDYNNTEYFSLTVDSIISFLYADKFNKFTMVENVENIDEDWGYEIQFTTSYRLLNLNPLDFVLVDELGIIFNCVTIEELDSSEQYNWNYSATFTNFNGANANLELQFKGLYGINEAGYLFDPFIFTFIPENLVKPDVPAPQIVSIVNTEDTGILITFDHPIVAGVTNSLNAFTVTSKYWKDTFEEVELTETHTISSISQPSSTTILLTFVYPTSRIRRANSMTVSYDSVQGQIVGESYPLESFFETFIPSIDKLLDPAIREYFKMEVDADINFIEMNFEETAFAEYFSMTLNATINFINMEIVNP